MSLWCVALLAALAFGFAMLVRCIGWGFATRVFRALHFVSYVSAHHELSMAEVVLLVNTCPRICVCEQPASISAVLDFVLPWPNYLGSAWSLPVEGRSFPVQLCRGCTLPALSIDFLHFHRLHREPAPKCPKQLAERLFPEVRWVPFGGFPREFDALKGFPGEGPGSHTPWIDPPLWSLSTANIGSLKTSTFWQSDFDTVYCLQETRIGRNNFRTSLKQVQATNRSLFCGELLSGIIRSDGRHVTMHGGTAIVAPEAIARAFDPKDDLTNCYAEIFKSKRVNACWIQVTATIRALVFSVYAKTGASASPEIMETNDQLLEKIFLIAAQFGNIPIIVAGDFQTNPLAYPSIAHAVHFEGWVDPLANVDAEGQLYRPITFSLDGTFTGEGEGCSSIDGILVNRVAFAALRSIDVVASHGIQHRPIRATFAWTPIHQIGEVHAKFAALDHSQWIKQPKGVDNDQHQAAAALWDNSFAEVYSQTTDFPTKWQLVNDFCLRTLLDNGSFWGCGARKRGALPVFKKKRICPGQLPSGSAATLKGSRLFKTLRQLWELETRLLRPSHTLRDAIIFQRTTKKVWKTLCDLQSPVVWIEPFSVTLVDLFHNIQWVRNEVSAWELRKKNARISAWKSSIRESAKGSKQFIFHHLKNKCLDEPANLVLDSDGNIIFNPQDAIATIASDWDSIFSANTLRHDPVQMLNVVWPYLDHDIAPFVLPPLTGADIEETIRHRNPLAAPGLDGWRTSDLQMLPRACCDVIADFFGALEEECNAVMPDVLTRAKQAILNKPGPSSPLNKRLITILFPMLLAYTGTRFRQLQQWQNDVLPKVLCGGIRHRDMSDVSTDLRLEIDEAIASDDPLVGIKLDQSKCFDRLVPDFAAALFLALGIPRGVVNVFLKMYASLKRHLSYRGWVSSTATTAANGVAQGCSLSLLAINAHMAVWSKFIALLPHVSCRVFIDDAYLWVRLSRIHFLEKALQVTEQWNLLIGQKLNPDKVHAGLPTPKLERLPNVCFQTSQLFWSSMH